MQFRAKKISYLPPEGTGLGRGNRPLSILLSQPLPFPDAQHIHSRSTLECAYRTHLVAGIGFYQHLLLYIQSHYQLELQCCIDWTHVTDPLIGQ